MPLYLPNEGWLVRFSLNDEALERLNETLQKHAWNVICEDGLLAFDLKAPVERFRARPDFVSAEKAWCFTGEDTHEVGCRFVGDYRYPSVRVVDRACIATQRDDALAALAESYPPVHLLWHVWNEEGGDLKRLARAALDGDEKAFGVLCDAMQDAGHPLAAVAARIGAEWLGLRIHAEGAPAVLAWKEYPRTLGLTADGSAVFIQTDGGGVRLLSVKDGKAVRGSKQDIPELRAGGETAFSSAAGVFVKASPGRLRAFGVGPWREMWSVEAGDVYRITVAADGSRLAAVCHDNTVRVWLTATGEELGVFPIRKTNATVHGFTSDARLALRSGGRLALWAPGRRVAWEDLAGGHDDRWFTIHPDGDRAAVFTRDMRVGVRVLATGELLGGLYDDDSPHILGFTADGRLFVTEKNRGLTAHDGRTGAVIACVDAREDFVKVALAADGSAVAGWCYGHGLRVWPLTRRVPDPVAVEMDFGILGVAVAPDGSRFVAAQEAPMCLIEHDAGGGVLSQVASFTGFTGVTAVAYSPDGQTLAAARFRLISLRSGKRQRVGIDVDADVRGLRFSADGRRLAAAFAGGEVAVYRVSDGRRLSREARHRWDCTAVAFAGSHLCSADTDGRVHAGGRVIAAGARVVSLDVSSSGLVAAVAGRRVLSEGEAITSLVASSVRFVGDDVLAVGCWGEVVLMRLPSREVLYRIPAGWGEVTSLDWAPAGRVLAMGCWDRQVRLSRLPAFG